MIDYLKGEITELTPTSATIECSGVGFFVNISLNTYTVLQGQKSTKIYIHEAIREDAHVLYGFAEKHEREIFQHLISVSGVGPATGRMVISSLTPKEIEAIIASENAKALQAVKGIGPKTAQRIIIDLKDKIKYTGDGDTVSVPAAVFAAGVGHEAVSALVMLGFTKVKSEKVVQQLAKKSPNLTLEELIKAALKMM